MGHDAARGGQPGAFQGLGLPIEPVLFKAARMLKRLARPLRQAVAWRAPAASALWGFALLVTLSRFTRAG